mmetsp:Transcript_13795/g.20200  ORF Transcript_13795/g.20200 Transcript_13795/m.20200 type:complete len:106 (-) Transcript_13795:477-794(-)
MAYYANSRTTSILSLTTKPPQTTRLLAFLKLCASFHLVPQVVCHGKERVLCGINVELDKSLLFWDSHGAFEKGVTVVVPLDASGACVQADLLFESGYLLHMFVLN